MSEIFPQIYAEILAEIKSRIRAAQGESLKIVEAEMRKVSFFEEAKFEFLDFDVDREKLFLSKVNKFLREYDNRLVFLGKNYRLIFSEKEYFIDLLLYHRALKSLVAIELKIGEFLPEYVGKMQFYLSVLNDKIKLADENPSIGIVLCKDKDKTIVEYALAQSESPIGIARYELVSKLPENLRGQLPTGEQINKLLEGI